MARLRRTFWRRIMADEILDQLEADAIDGVQRVSVDGVSVDSMSVDDRIKAAKFVASERAKNKKHFGLQFVKLIPPGAQ